MSEISELKEILYKIETAKSHIENNQSKDETLILLNDVILNLRDKTYSYDEETKEEMTKEFINYIYDNIEYFPYLNADRTIDIAPTSYDDVISSFDMKRFIDDFINTHNTVSSLTFDEYMYDAITDFKAEEIFDCESEVIAEIIDFIKEKAPDNIKRTYAMLLEDGFNTMDLLNFVGYEGYNIDWHDYLMNKYDVNLMFATDKEKNFDMCSISDMTQDIGNFNIDNLHDFKEICDNALTYLIHSQGYTLNDFYNASYDEDSELRQSKFLKSLIEEVYELSYCMNELTILVSINKDNIDDFANSLVDDTKDFVITKDDNNGYDSFTIGLFNEWQGAGSVFDICLEKDLHIPTTMLRNWQMENVNDRELNNGYTVDTVYGFQEYVWDMCVKIENSENRPKMVDEDYSEAFETICEEQEKEEENKRLLEYQLGD